jgi:hypothetical protein
MKIYFTASLTGKKYYLQSYKKIVRNLKKIGCQIFYKHIFTSSKSQICQESKEKRQLYLKLLNKNLKWCDLVVVEVSYPSTATGFEISTALKKNKPVLALYLEKKGDIPPVFKAFDEDKITLLSYNLNNLNQLLKDYLEYIKTLVINKRFTLLLPPQIVEFLDKKSKENKMFKSEYIRNLIKQEMNKK